MVFDDGVQSFTAVSGSRLVSLHAMRIHHVLACELTAPCRISIHDLTTGLVNAALDDSVTNKRYTIGSPEPFSSQLAADTFRQLFDWAKERVAEGEPGKYPDVAKLEGEIAKKELLGGKDYVAWKETILEAVGQFKEIEDKEKARAE